MTRNIHFPRLVWLTGNDGHALAGVMHIIRWFVSCDGCWSVFFLFLVFPSFTALFFLLISLYSMWHWRWRRRRRRHLYGILPLDIISISTIYLCKLSRMLASLLAQTVWFLWKRKWWCACAIQWTYKLMWQSAFTMNMMIITVVNEQCWNNKDY